MRRLVLAVIIRAYPRLNLFRLRLMAALGQHICMFWDCFKSPCLSLSFAQVVATLAFLLFAPAALRAADKPNVLFLFADDQRADTIAAHGNPHIKTPHLDKLAAAGFSFRGNYVFGGNSGAVCVPSRAMLMSGKTWFDNGMMAGGRDENLGAWPRTEAMIRDQLAEYYGMITHMDEQIGRILSASRIRAAQTTPS